MTPDLRTARDDTRATAGGITLDDVRREAGDRWQITKITGGYRTVTHEPGGTLIPRYGRTPAELLESIRYVEGQA